MTEIRKTYTYPIYKWVHKREYKRDNRKGNDFRWKGKLKSYIFFKSWKL